MLSFINRSVRFRMLGGFAVMLCITCGVGLFAIDRLGTGQRSREQDPHRLAPDDRSTRRSRHDHDPVSPA